MPVTEVRSVFNFILLFFSFRVLKPTSDWFQDQSFVWFPAGLETNRQLVLKPPSTLGWSWLTLPHYPSPSPFKKPNTSTNSIQESKRTTSPDLWKPIQIFSLTVSPQINKHLSDLNPTADLDNKPLLVFLQGIRSSWVCSLR